MMSARAIRQEAQEAGEYARQNGYVPLLVTEASLSRAKKAWREGRRPDMNIPYIGDYVPKGYRKVGHPLFVDTTGRGAPDEPALTVEQFLNSLKPGLAYAIVEAGQFQAYVQAFRPPVRK